MQKRQCEPTTSPNPAGGHKPARCLFQHPQAKRDTFRGFHSCLGPAVGCWSIATPPSHPPSPPSLAAVASLKRGTGRLERPKRWTQSLANRGNIWRISMEPSPAPPNERRDRGLRRRVRGAETLEIAINEALQRVQRLLFIFSPRNTTTPPEPRLANAPKAQISLSSPRVASGVCPLMDVPPFHRD